jgi:heptosyltransferase-1/heptosyltransferase-2
VKNILFIRLRLMGDIIFTMPAVGIFKRRFPGTRIFYVVEEEFSAAARMIPGVHRVISIPRKMSVAGMWKFRKDIKSLGIDTVIDFHSGPKSAQLTRITGANVRIGYRTANRNWAYNRLTPRDQGEFYTHSVYNQAKLLEHLGILVEDSTIPGYPKITVKETDVRPFVREAVKKAGEKVKRVVIHVGAGNVYREWELQKFASLMRQLRHKGLKVFLVGSGEEERKKAAYLDNLHHINIEDLTGRLTIPELFYLVAHSSVYVGADSGPLHLASLTDTPLVALYGPNIPQVSGPWRKQNVTVIQKAMDCQPCDQRKCVHGTIPCMKNITADEVYEAIIRYIK